MSRTRLTWILVGGVGTLLFVAGVDALRSSETETATPPTRAPTTVEEVVDTLPPCTRRQVAVSIEAPKGFAVIVVRNVGGTPCHQVDLGFRLTIRDRAGNRVRLLPAPPTLPSGGDLTASSRQTFPFPSVPHCPRQGPFVALATVGPTPRVAATSHGARSRAAGRRGA